MRKLSLIIIIVGVLSVVLVPVHVAHAHVLIRDTSGSKGAILHIIPDDDPIAGKKATLFFDMQSDANDVSKVSLEVTQQGSDEIIPVKAKLDGSLATADFTFPSQGVYLLKYQVRTNNDIHTFEQSTRISRGIIIGSVDKPRYTWAEGLLVVCGITFAVLAIVAFNRRRDIAKQSTF